MKTKLHHTFVRLIFGILISGLLLYIMYDKLTTISHNFTIKSHHMKCINNTHCIRYVKAVTKGIRNIYPFINRSIIYHYYCDEFDGWSLLDDSWSSYNCIDDIDINVNIYIDNNYKVIQGNNIIARLVPNVFNITGHHMPFFVNDYIWIAGEFNK